MLRIPIGAMRAKSVTTLFEKPGPVCSVSTFQALQKLDKNLQ
jgi:hypothetical protein